MLRTAMKPRFVRLFVVMLALVAAFVWLGQWQWNVAHSKANDHQLQSSSLRGRAPLTSLVKPQTQFDNALSLRPISVTGHYDTAKTRLVAGRVLDKRTGYWLMTPLVVDGSGARLPIVRGFVTRTDHLPKPPSGRVTLEGALAPGESVSTMGALPAGQIGAIDMGSLLNEWGGDVYNAFIFMSAQHPLDSPTPGEAHVDLVPAPVPHRTTIEWRNAAYAFQWWIFAVFAVFMWVRLVREEHQLEQAAARPDHASSDAGTHDDSADHAHDGAGASTDSVSTDGAREDDDEVRAAARRDRSDAAVSPQTDAPRGSAPASSSPSREEVR